MVANFTFCFLKDNITVQCSLLQLTAWSPFSSAFHRVNPEEGGDLCVCEILHLCDRFYSMLDVVTLCLHGRCSLGVVL